MPTQAIQRHDSFGILLVPGFPVYALMMIIELLRLANIRLLTPTYDWRIISYDGNTVRASNGMLITPDAGIRQVAHLGTLIVLAGFSPEQSYHPDLLQWLRKITGLGARTGGIDTGPFILAKAGLLNEHPVTVHWQAMSIFQEEFPFISTTEALFTLSDSRFTCAGGSATLDLMFNLIALEQGYETAQKIAQDFVHDQIRLPSENQRSAYDQQWQHSHPLLAKILKRMEDNLEEPLSIEQLIDNCGLSRRQMERIFKRDLGTTAMHHYLVLRLNKARQLILYSKVSIQSVALACGFNSMSVFSRAYKIRFGNSPRQHRSIFKAQGLSSNLSHLAPPLSIDARSTQVD